MRKGLSEPKATLKPSSWKNNLWPAASEPFSSGPELQQGQWGSSEVSTGIFQPKVIRRDLVPAGSKKKTFPHLPAGSAGVGTDPRPELPPGEFWVLAAQTDLHGFGWDVDRNPSSEETSPNYPVHWYLPLVLLLLHKEAMASSPREGRSGHRRGHKTLRRELPSLGLRH